MPSRRSRKRYGPAETRSGRPGRRARAPSFVNPANRDGTENKDFTMTEKGDDRQVSRASTDRGRTTNSAPDPEEARAGEVVFKGPRQRWIFFAAVIGAVVVAGGIALTVY